MPVQNANTPPPIVPSFVEAGEPQSTPSVAPAPRPSRTESDSVSDHAPSQQNATNNSPTSSAREAATRKHAELQEVIEERLMSDPEYVELKKMYDEANANLMSDFLLVDQFTGIWPDKKIQMQDLIALKNDTLANPEARAAASRLLANSKVWQDISHADNLVDVTDVEAFLASKKGALAEMRRTVTAEVKEEIKAETANAATAGGGVAGAGATGTGAPGTGATGPAGPLFTASTPSTKSGMEGAVENVNNAIKSIGTSMNSIMAEIADPKTTPERRKDLQNQYNELQQLQSMLTAMYTQMQEAIANLMKMYSDVAMNSVRNMK